MYLTYILRGRRYLTGRNLREVFVGFGQLGEVTLESESGLFELLSLVHIYSYFS